MGFCVNKNNPEYQALLKRSGLPDLYLAAVCSDFLEKHDRFPNLDEISGADSREHISQQLSLKNGGTSINTVLETTGTADIPSAQIKLNQLYSDQEIGLTPLTTEVIVTMTPRPTTKPVSESIEHSDINSALLFSSILDKLTNLYGVQINHITSEDIQNSELKDVPGVTNSSAFVWNNQIYVNTEFADKDAPIHEMMHILMGGLRTNNPKLYFQIADWISKQEVFRNYQDLYPHRTMSDVAEEAFVGEFARLTVGKQSVLKNFSNRTKYELFYHAKRVLDSILMGESSIKDYSDTTIFNSSLRELCALVNSGIDVNKFPASVSLENGEAHRLLSNKKHELMESNELEEHCYA